MNRSLKSIVDEDPWRDLKAFTDARISLGRVGTSLPLVESLAFKLAHAEARDAVLAPLNCQDIKQQLLELEIQSEILSSSIKNRSEYLTRPDKGRILSMDSLELLQKKQADYDIAIVVCDGLSSRAIHENCVDLIDSFMKTLSSSSLRVAPVQIVTNGRVALGDQVGETLGAVLTIMLIGERPGLSSPNSMGIYITYSPRVGNTDEARNCISNVRDGGLSIPLATQKLCYLVESAISKKLSGVNLKDEMNENYLPFSSAVL